jgi:hypothetical protein
VSFLSDFLLVFLFFEIQGEVALGLKILGRKALFGQLWIDRSIAFKDCVFFQDKPRSVYIAQELMRQPNSLTTSLAKISPLTAPPITTSLACRAPFEAACFRYQNLACAVQVAD